ncbi:DUF3090 domain-containing protein [Paeniglutamicibacter psychrophenolicus]|uniref:Repeat protein (TIGR03847 family) n=1 Tax=Paeniglutamicibacter psychrophenolicus TaxID=257454 RepID=A0ABS4WD53_9MICC|nr:DUF3090 domain-containing protein [Paeniglutamicibacter psychrophenolicus]MBP2374136.1 putative repeat protein (TIGR03847 family) [Paeniglutamicibacter psychrophenolicus]
MSARIHEFAWPDRVVVGTIGLPGSRTFYLQVRAGAQVVSIAMEKQQSALLAEKIDEILDELITLEGNPFSVPTGTPIELVDNDPLEAVQEQFRTGAMSLGWDPTTAQLVIEAHPLPSDDPEDNDESLHEDPTDDPEMLRVRMPVGTARAFTKRTREIVGAGRPMCPLCGYPMDADGHTCTFSES